MAFVLNEQQCGNLEYSTKREWILTNGIGGFAMGTASGINTRRYHGLLVAANPPPETRTVLVAEVDAFMQGEGQPIGISSNQYPGAIYPDGYHQLRKFSAGQLAHWQYRSGTLQVDRKLEMHPGENAITLSYRNSGEAPLLLTLNPLVCHKFYHGNFAADPGYPQVINFQKDKTLLEHNGLKLVIQHPHAQRIPVQGWYYRFEHAREIERGLEPRDDLYCPFELRYELLPGESAVIVAADNESVRARAVPHEDESSEFRMTAQLRESCKHFLIKTPQRTTIMAGYPWFTDWGRDTMIALPGVCLHTGEVSAARDILESFASQMKMGLVPNRFVESGEEPQYNTVDGTLWFAYAIHKTLVAEWHETFAKKMLEVLKDVITWHTKGTLYGIRVTPEDGLLTQGEDGVQLTWMDAKVGDWVVTPRHGKPVEINGLWINLLRVCEWLSEKLGQSGKEFTAAAEKAEKSFEAKFWNEHLGFYLDTVDPDDATLRPNQLIAMSLPFAPAKGEHAKRALQQVTQQLLTSAGLRTLGPEEPGYKGRYAGPMPEKDAAYHQGTVWPWLLGPYVSALVKLTSDQKEAKRILRQAKEMLGAYGLGGIAEVYDGDEPQDPNGCPWQAWSSAEILRAWIEDAGGD